MIEGPGPATYALLGGAVLVLALVAGRLLEGRWLPPAALFFAAFTLHGFLDPLVRAGRDPMLAAEFTGPVLLFTLQSFLCLVAGYVLVLAPGRLLSRGADEPTAAGPLFGRLGVQIATLAVVLILANMYATLLRSGALQEAKGFTAYQGGFLRQMLLINTAVFALLGALTMARQGLATADRRRLGWFLAVAVGLVVLHSLLQFGRRGVFTIGLILVLIHHYRVRPLTARHLGILAAAVVGVTIFSLLRSVGAGITQFGAGEAREALDLAVASPAAVPAILAKTLPGQAVFSRTMEMVPALEGHRWGATYWNSAVGLFMPNFLTGNYDLATPAFWFKQAWAPGREGHGFDFSMLAEAYLNFGAWGPLVFLAVGAALGAASRAILRSPSALVTLWSIIVLVDLVVGLRNDSNAIFKRMVYFMVPVLIIVLLERLLTRAMAARGAVDRA